MGFYIMASICVLLIIVLIASIIQEARKMINPPKTKTFKKVKNRKL